MISIPAYFQQAIAILTAMAHILYDSHYQPLNKVFPVTLYIPCLLSMLFGSIYYSSSTLIISSTSSTSTPSQTRKKAVTITFDPPSFLPHSAIYWSFSVISSSKYHPKAAHKYARLTEEIKVFHESARI